MIYLYIYLAIGLLIAGAPTHKDLKGGCEYGFIEWLIAIGAMVLWPVLVVWAWFAIVVDY